MHDHPLHPQSHAQGAMRPPATDNGGFSPARLERMHAALRRHVESGLLPGLVALVHYRGREHVDVVGHQAFDSNVPIRRDTIFRLASMTKPITAVGAMILVEECRIRLDDPVDEWLPELKDRRVLRTIESPLDDTVPANRPITLRDLLTFRSGYGELGFLSPTCPLQKTMSEAGLTLAEWPFTVTPDDFMKRLGNFPLAHQPGERWLYHTASEILGVLIARVSGTSLATFLRERIFEPLGMTDTGFHVPEAKLDRLPICYGRDFLSGEVVVLHEAHGGLFGRPPAFESGGGGLVSTVDDLLAFGRMMLDDGAYGSERVLSRPTVELMTMDHITPEQKAASPFFAGFWNDHGWGLGMAVFTARRDLAGVPGRFGWDGAFGTSWWVDPKERMVGVFMTQRRPDVLAIPAFILDFWTSAYQLIDG
ncbi:serine hydrolase domain-containing protein [Billgrantia ethanolica]|uniref:Beta-lactamase family protein n=1 Tax=Billgrantia ethanolica TaxID=2733486 RepID=A0ABS9A3L3_9GAMM|nr:serine hydrolase domain-containing protein [Halomonas ethanolica]MCE8002888.1 beta-lactamase family protein [Halomonas ethanolica]